MPVPPLAVVLLRADGRRRVRAYAGTGSGSETRVVVRFDKTTASVVRQTRGVEWGRRGHHEHRRRYEVAANAPLCSIEVIAPIPPLIRLDRDAILRQIDAPAFQPAHRSEWGDENKGGKREVEVACTVATHEALVASAACDVAFPM